MMSSANRWLLRRTRQRRRHRPEGTQFGAAPAYTLQTVTFNSGPNTTLTVYAGFFGQGVDQFIQLDDISLM